MFSVQDCGRCGTGAQSHLFVAGLWFGEAPSDENAVGGAGEGAPEGDGTLEEAARREREYLINRLRDELGRDPGEAELNEWLRQHTEGY